MWITLLLSRKPVKRFSGKDLELDHALIDQAILDRALDHLEHAILQRSQVGESLLRRERVATTLRALLAT